MKTKELLESYCANNSSEEPLYLQELSKSTWLNTTNPRMLTGHLQGRLLSMLSKLVQPNLVIEIGTFTGYGALCFAEGLAKNGKVMSIEVNPEHAYKAQEFIKKTPFAKQIEVLNLDGMKFLECIDERADIIYVDGEKRSYIKYLDACNRVLRVGGLAIFDNTLWGGKVVHDSMDRDTEIMKEFNQALVKQIHFETLQLPLRDGVTIVRKKG